MEDLTPLEPLIATGRWHDLLAALAEKPWERTARAWLPAVEARVAGAVRDADRAWPQEYFTRKKAPAGTPLVRALRLPPRTQGAMKKLVAQLGTLDPATMPPLTHLEVTDYARRDPVAIDAGAAAVLWEKLALARLERVEIHCGASNGPLVESMHEQPALCAVRELALRNVTRERVSTLARSAHLGAVRALLLDVAPSTELDAGAFAAAFAPRLELLQFQQWGGWAQEFDYERALWGEPWPALAQVNLGWLKLSRGFLRALFGAAPALGRVFLRRCEFADGVAAPEGPTTGALRGLSLSDCALGDADLAALLRSPACVGLTQVSLDDQRDLGDETLAALGALPSLARLTVTGAPPRNPAGWSVLRAAVEARAR